MIKVKQVKILSPVAIRQKGQAVFHFKNKVYYNTFITISVYEIPHLRLPMFCGADYFLTFNRNITIICYNNTCL